MLIYSLRLTKAAQLVFDQAKITDIEEEVKDKAPEKEKNVKTAKAKAAKTTDQEDAGQAAAQEEEKSVKKTTRKTVKKKNPAENPEV